MTDKIKKGLPYSLILLLGAWAGFFIGVHYFPRTVEKPVVVQGKAVTKTEIAYIPKETVVVKYIDAATGQEVTTQQREAVDLDAKIGKTDFVVRLNGKETMFSKAEDEQYMFDKNKLALTQSSTVTIDARVQPVNETKRWSIGVGYGNHGMAYKVDFPVGQLGGWAYRDDESKAAGISVRF